MLSVQNNLVNFDLICAVREGELEKARKLINYFGLSYSKAWSGGYNLLCDAIKNKHTAVTELLLTSGSKVNSKSKKLTDTPLHLAVINNDIEIVQMLLEKYANINATNKDYDTPLNMAIKNKKIEVTELLLKYGADVNVGASPLQVAIEMGCFQTVEHLLNYGAYVNCVYTRRQMNMWLYNGLYTNGYTPLHIATANGRKEIVTLLLIRGANVDGKEEDNITPLHIAAKNGYVHIAEDLLNHGACINSLTLKEGYTPLHFASNLNALDSEKTIKLFLNRGADINASTKGNLTPLHIATKIGHTTGVKLLLQHGAKVDNQDKDGKTILHLAVETGCLMIVEDVLKYCPDINNQSNRNSLKIAVHGYNKEYKKIVEALLEYGLIVNPEDANNPKLLYAAVKKGYLKMVEALLQHYGDINASDEDGRTALHFTALSDRYFPNEDPNINIKGEIAKLLLSKGANVDAQTKNGETTLHAAIQDGYTKVVEALLEYNANINSRGKNDITPLHLSAQNGNEEISTMLLSKGANVNAKQKDGITALHVATQRGHKEIVRVLLEYGAKVNSKNKSDITPLHLAAQNGYQEIIETILKFGADINSRDEDGRTALHIASEKKHIKIIVTLLKYGSDINITTKNNFTPFDYAMTRKTSYYGHFYNSDSDDDYYDHLDCGIYSNKIITKAFKRHIIKMETANLYISEKNVLLMKIDEYNSKINEFQDKCKKEITNMKSEKINNANISFYDILAKSTNSLEIYMRNKNIVQVLKSGNYKTKFPIYASMIESNFRKGMERKELLEQGNKIFHFFFNNFLVLPLDCTEKIMNYLSNEDLRNLMDVS